MPALLRLFRRFMLRPSLLDSHLQASVARGAGLHATTPQGEPRPGALPAVSMWRWAQLPNTARTKQQALIAILFIIIIFSAGGGSKIQVCGALFLVSPLIYTHLFIGVKAVSGKDETSRVPEGLEEDGGMRRVAH